MAQRSRVARLFRAGALLAGLLVVAQCSDGLPVPPSDGYVALGTWGSSDAGLIATDSVTHVHVGCTFGDVAGRIELDSEGRFAVDGSFVLRAYPVMVGPPLPAHFSGQVRGGRLTLVIAVNDTVENRLVALGPIVVEFGREPGMVACPICDTPSRAAILPTRSHR